MKVRAIALSRRRVAADLAAMTLFAALTAVGARLSFHLSFTPVPVTGQVFCVLLAGAALGPWLGFASLVEYLVAGAAGLPIFAHGGGLAAMLGPTAGYLLGYPFAAMVVGLVSGRGNNRWRLLAGCGAGVVTIYVFGASWFVLWSGFTGKQVALMAALGQSVFPFIAIDAAKAGLAAAVTPRVRRRLAS
jgi:biotin transport system substrate-specific component